LTLQNGYVVVVVVVVVSIVVVLVVVTIPATTIVVIIIVVVVLIMNEMQSAITIGIDSVKSNIQSLLDDVKANEDTYGKRVRENNEAYERKVKACDESYSIKVKSLNDDKEQWEKEKSTIASSHTFDARIKIDVGGAHFTTTSATLTRFPDTMLGAMFSGRHKLVIDESGHYFIDRDGTHFRHVLNYLRNPKEFDQTTIDAVHKKELKKEAEYYGLGELMFPAPEEIEAKDKNGKVVVCKKVDGVWKCSFEGSMMAALYYCRVCKSACRSQNYINNYTNYIPNFDSLVSIDPKQPAPTQCAKCLGY